MDKTGFTGVTGVYGMNESDDELQQLAGEYVLGTLSAAQRKEVEQRLSREEAA